MDAKGGKIGRRKNRTGTFLFPINAHCIDGEIDIENQFHEFVADKPAWLKIGDNAQQFEAHPN
ncbi:hypothetical protein [Pseudoalteromonas sp.]|uniref:hypothetical protein n=1 Tax=Pseudoalteromonas sp. TaxID=53249 RepID=UPI0030036DD1